MKHVQVQSHIYVMEVVQNMNVVNVIEIGDEIYFMGDKPAEEVLESMIEYDSRFATAEVITGERLKEIKMKLSITSAAACGYRLVSGG